MKGLRQKFSGLRRQVWIYFLPMLIVIFCIGAYLILEAEDQLMQYRMILAIFSALALLMVIPFLFIHNIVKPLEQVLHAVRKITEGNLEETVPIRNSDEIGKIGEQINALSVNIQEILLHVWNHSRDAVVFSERIERYILSQNSGSAPPDVTKDIVLIRNSMEEIQNMVKTFEYYDIRMDEDRLTAKDVPDRREKEKIS